jgi:hypothetical protein
MHNGVEFGDSWYLPEISGKQGATHSIWDTHSVLYQLWTPKWCIFWVQVTVAFNKDPSPMKVNLGVGAYRTEVCVKNRAHFCRMLWNCNYLEVLSYTYATLKTHIVDVVCDGSLLCAWDSEW